MCEVDWVIVGELIRKKNINVMTQENMHVIALENLTTSVITCVSTWVGKDAKYCLWWFCAILPPLKSFLSYSRISVKINLF